MQENKITLLSTRPVDAGWVALAAEKGIFLEAVSFIETEPIPGDEAADLRLADLSRMPATIVFTSMNAVDAVANRISGLPDGSRSGAGWRIFCIGQATRQRVIRYFGEPAIAGTADSALSLAETILTHFREDSRGRGDSEGFPEVIFFCGDQRRDELPDRLRENSVPVTEIVVYKTIRMARTLERRYDGILFFSPSAVDSFFPANQLPEGTVLFAIGATTAAAVRKHSSNRVIIGESPAKEILIGQAIEFFTKI
ncbi:MAG: uroporphyrinogen-III synthase [Puia sp.]|nr:uroporphyrinogen-III synthase [Puia sp.]